MRAEIAAAAAAAAASRGVVEEQVETYDQNCKSYAERFSGVFHYHSAQPGSDKYVEVAQHNTHIGGAVYSAGVVMCRYLEQMQLSDPDYLSSKNVLELGGGTGLVGCCAALLLGANVQTTDMGGDPMMLLEQNVQANLARFGDSSGSIISAELDWIQSKANNAISMEIASPLHFVIGSDLVYEHIHPDALLWVLCAVCPPPSESVLQQTEVIIASDRRGRVGLKRFINSAKDYFTVVEVPLDSSSNVQASQHVSLITMLRKPLPAKGEVDSAPNKSGQPALTQKK